MAFTDWFEKMMKEEEGELKVRQANTEIERTEIRRGKRTRGNIIEDDVN